MKPMSYYDSSAGVGFEISHRFTSRRGLLFKAIALTNAANMPPPPLAAT
jgi:hypothetical protein